MTPKGSYVLERRKKMKAEYVKDKQQQHHQVYDLDVKDELNDKLHYRLRLMGSDVKIDEISEDDQAQSNV